MPPDPDDPYARSRPYTPALLAVVPRRDPRERHQGHVLRGETPVAVHIPAGCRFHPRCPVVIEACRSTEPSLEPTGAHHRAACLLTTMPA